MNENEKWIESETLELESFCSASGTLHIPSYQRGYEWDAYNVQRLVYSVYDGTQEDTFLGTIQISINDQERFIVDGRQRLTTLALLNAVLAKRYGVEPFHRLETLIDDPMLNDALNEIAVRNLKVFSTVGNRGDVTRLNRKGRDDAQKETNIYLRNAAYINTILESDHFPKTLSKDTLESMFRTLFFIVVSIKNRELTQVIRIFDTLNSTGQELSDEAMFKLRYHSYLRAIGPKGQTSEAIMDGINKGYQKVDTFNGSPDKLVPVDMKDILWGYRTYLLTLQDVRKYLQPSDMTLGTLAFFETLFGKIEQPIEALSLNGFETYIAYHLEYYRYAYPANKDFGINTPSEAVERALPDLLAWSRYGNAWAILIAFYVVNRIKGKGQADSHSKAVNWAKPIFQALYYYSVIYQKSVKRIKTGFLWDSVGKTDQKELIDFCSTEIQNEEANRKKWGYPSFWTTIRENFYGEYGQAYVFLAAIEAYEEMNDRKDFYAFIHSVFPWERKAKRPQIEHIFCRKLFVDDSSLSETQRARLNGLGNLVLLEESINKNSLKDHQPSDKFRVSQRGKDFFHDSRFSSVKRLCSDYEEVIKDGADYDIATKWLDLADSRFLAMKKTFTSLFDFFANVE